MNQITRNIIFDVKKSSAENTVSISRGTADPYRLAMHIAGIGAPKDLSDFTVTIRAIKPDGTEVQESCTVSGNTAYYVIEPQCATEPGNIDCLLKISQSEQTLYTMSFRCIITDGGESEEWYVTPEMCGACEDGSEDDSTALQQAFNDGRNVIFLRDYYITDKVNIVNKSNLKVYGNNHTLRVSSKEPTDEDGRIVKYAFNITNCENISFQDLTIESVADQNLIAIEYDKSNKPRIYTDHFKSSNVQGFKVQKTDNLSIRNYTSYNLWGDISLQTCTKVGINHWYSNNSLMGLYTSDVEDVLVSTFKIVSDPENTIGHFHAFYLCHETKHIYISDGEAIFENMWENVENVSYLNGDNPTKVTLRTPLFTIHGGAEGKWQKGIYVDNVKFTAQRIINVERMIDAPVFSNCTFTTHYPENPLAASSDEEVRRNASAEGQLTFKWNTVFNDCTFHLGSLNMGLGTGNVVGNNYKILLNDCQLYCTNAREDVNNEPLLLGYWGKFKLINCSIEWPSFVRRLKHDDIVTAFYNCYISLSAVRAVIRYENKNTTTTETFIINCFVKGGYYVWYDATSQEGKLNIIGSNLVSNTKDWYLGALDAFPGSVKVYNSYHNDTKISTIPGTAGDDALTLHTVDPHAHTNLELDGNDLN